MKPNQGKCHLLVADIDHTHYSSKSYIYLEDEFLESEESVKLLGVQIDRTLKFEEHINFMLKEGNKKLDKSTKVLDTGKIKIDHEDFNRITIQLLSSYMDVS